MGIINGVGINGLGAATPGDRVRRGTPGSRFHVPDEPAAETAAGEPAALGPAAEVSLGGLLALQAGEELLVQDRAAHRRGRDLLDSLAMLQRGLLRGRLDPGDLRRLAALAEDVPRAVDPRLGRAIEAIVLRTQVEIARLAYAQMF